jgi:hypothetical protein
MNPAEDFADNVGEEGPKEAGNCNEDGEDLFRRRRNLCGNGAGQVIGAEAVANGAAAAALASRAEVEAGALVAGRGLRQLHIPGLDAELVRGFRGRSEDEFPRGMDLKGRLRLVWLWTQFNGPQRLKPRASCDCYGTTKVVP